MRSRLLPFLLLPLTAASASPPATPDEARAFVKTVNAEMKALAVKGSTADWIKSTYITGDTERASAWA
ncbi:MAG: M2 family metallopeptidase, partial [Myxococcaceae bacterium]